MPKRPKKKDARTFLEPTLSDLGGPGLVPAGPSVGEAGDPSALVGRGRNLV
jgi:hypothetical protein